MRYADSKDIKRAQDLGKHSGAVHSSPTEIARGKASSMAAAITDKRKILGRLEAISNVWKDYNVLLPFIERCIVLWPNSQYEKAYAEANKQATYLKTEIRRLNINYDFLIRKYLINQESGNFINGDSYEFDEVARIIFNAILKRKLTW